VRDEHNEQSHNSMNATRYQVLGEYIVRIDPTTESIRLKCAKQNKHVKKRGLDSRLVEVIKRVARESGTETIIGYTRATIYENNGHVTKYNAHPFYHGAEWYDWTYVCYHIKGNDGESEFQYYPSKILGFIRSKTGEVQAVVQCSEKPLPWSQLEQKFVCKFDLCSSFGKEQIVPILSLSDPLCVVKDFGGSEDKYMLILPKGLWSEYYARFVKKVNG
jgi:hypothetical protein